MKAAKHTLFPDSVLGSDQFHHLRPRLLYLEREPLFDPDKKLILFWSQKSGCTSVIKWFFQGMGLLEEALAYDAWIHKYRMWVYVDPAWFLSFPSAFVDESYLKLRVVRNPYTRCVSGFIHLLDNKNVYMPDMSDSFSFLDYLSWLEGQDLDQCNGHFARQHSAFHEHFHEATNEIIHLENLSEEVNSINERYNLNNPFHDELSKSRHHYGAVEQEEHSPVHDWPHKRVHAEKPDRFRFFQEAAVAERIYALYRPDFEPYGYAQEPPL